ncbi:MAG: hypothetical protein R3B99_02760 [Polyangiales bacterium]
MMPGLADVDRVAPTEVAAVAHRADTTLGVAVSTERMSTFSIAVLDEPHEIFVDLLVLLDEHLAGDRILDVLERDATGMRSPSAVTTSPPSFELGDPDAVERLASRIR